MRADRDPIPPAADPDVLLRVREVWERTKAIAAIPKEASVHFEGSQNEGFGNAGSDTDFLLLVPNGKREAIGPTVLFVDGRRVEVRSQSHDQALRRLHAVRRAIDTRSLRGVTEDLLNRVQRFVRGSVLHEGPGHQELLDVLSYGEFADLVSRWWLQRAAHCLRQSAALALLGSEDEAVVWAREGLTQSMKAFLAAHGETYIEVKWLPMQLDRLRRRAGPDVREVLDGYLALERARQSDLGTDALLRRAFDVAARCGAPEVSPDPGNLVFRRQPGVVSWLVGDSAHVVLDRKHVLVLSPGCAASWRKVVFGRTLAQLCSDDNPVDKGHLRRFAMCGMTALHWRGAGRIRPAAAMSGPDRPLLPPAAAARPPVTVKGGACEHPISRSPLPAPLFAECAFAMLWSTIVLENAREDFAGALANQQWGVATLCARRIAVMAVRSLISAYGTAPLPSDAVLLHAGEELAPDHADLIRQARALHDAAVADQSSASLVAQEAEAFITAVHLVTTGERFVSSYDSQEAWAATLRHMYQWLRIVEHTNAFVELEETRGALAGGGALLPSGPVDGGGR